MDVKENSLMKTLNGLLEGQRGGLVLNGLIVVLVVVSLLLPPVSAQERVLEAGFTTIDQEACFETCDLDFDRHGDRRRVDTLFP